MKGVKQLIGVGIDNPSSLGWEVTESPQPEVADRAIRLRGRRGAPPPPWATSVVSRIQELDSIAIGDPHSIRPLDFDDVADALEFLEHVMHHDTCPPWIGRLSSGGVQLTWHHVDVEVEAVFDRLRDEREVIVVVGENEWPHPADNAESLFATVVDRLSVSYIEHTPTA
jgi:hypothetical protein